MLNLLIADDEKIIRESLANCLDWEKIGISVVGCCADGLEALECVIDGSPDIIMTDIKMPGLNGLELIGKMREMDNDIEFIILSGYREFDFAKTAIELGVRRYLLKPLSEDQVMDAVTDAIKYRSKQRSFKAAVEERNRLRGELSSYSKYTRAGEASVREPLGLSEPPSPANIKSENILVQKVKEHVRSSLSDSSLSLKQIAAQYAYVNADYLSRLFVRETGEKFSHYLNRQRIEKAKQLLKENTGKVFQVAEQVGLGHNPRYFSQVFRKYTGITPSAYTETM